MRTEYSKTELATSAVSSRSKFDLSKKWVSFFFKLFCNLVQIKRVYFEVLCVSKPIKKYPKK